jgi:hypothetical protein
MAIRSVTPTVLFLALAAAAPVTAQGAGKSMKPPEGRSATVTGTVVDVSCKFGQGLSGDEHRMCAQVCSDKGIPLAILTDDGKLFIPTSPAMPGDAQNGLLKEHAERRVTVKGKVFPAGGAQAIQIESVSPAKA